MNRFELPTASGAYRWWYADVTAGDFTAVFIFMVGSIFSARYSAALKRGGLPTEHAAVNFALYEKGARWQWVLSEYQQVRVEDEGRTLRVGDSSMRYSPEGEVTMQVVDRTAPWGERAEATVRLKPTGPSHDEVRLVDGLSHFWRPIAARADAQLSLPLHGLELSGRGYHDGNRGDVPLGTDLKGWQWVRTHRPEATEVVYRPWGAPALSVRVDAHQASVQRAVLPVEPLKRTAWGLKAPSTLGVGGDPMLLESSPFYARLESEQAGAQAVGEVADFERFHRPWVRWMAHFRTRAKGAA